MTAKQELQTKHQRVVEHLSRHDLDAAILTRRRNFAWYTGGGQNYVNFADDVGVATLVVTPDRAVCVTSSIEAERMWEEEVGRLGIEVIECPWHDAEAATRVFVDLIGDKRAARDCSLPALPDSVRPLAPDFDRLRWQLSPGEVERYGALGKDTAACLEQVCRSFPQGSSEFELAGRLSELLLARHARPHVLLVAADDRIKKFRHPIPTRARVKQMAMVVVCAERAGLICSATRLFRFGPADADLRRRHEAVCRVDAAMMAATRPGRTLGDVWDTMTEAYAKVGFADEWRLHHQGGPTGYATREARALPGSDLPILRNQAFAWNPSITGTKSEDTILVGRTDREILTGGGDWPAVRAEWPDVSLSRPDILVR